MKPTSKILSNSYREILLINSKRKAIKGIKNYLSNPDFTGLHIGAGGNIIQGWFNTDLEPQGNNVFYLDASKKFPIPDNTFDYIFSEHIFEHLTIEQQINMLTESYRILKIGGKTRIATPNFDFIMSIFNTNDPDTIDYIKWNAAAFLSTYKKFFGAGIEKDVFVINNFFHDWGHQFIHNPYSLTLFLEKSSFKDIQQCKVGQSTEINFQNLEKHGEVITKRFNEMETMIFEATK